MLLRCCMVAFALTFYAVAALASPTAQAGELVAYGPGGPHQVLRECAALFKERYGTTVSVIKARPRELARRIQEDGDIFFTGAHYMLDEFERDYPGVLDLSTADKLYPRQIGILVRKGNPLDIRGFHSLRKDGIKLMKVILENMEPFITPFGNSSTVSVQRLVYTGLEGAKTWRSYPDIDAWVTYESWFVWLDDDSEFIEIPCDHALRYTMVALTKRTRKQELAKKFIGFLKSPEAQLVFEKHGWSGGGAARR